MTELIVRHCAPVLMGIKTGNLVTCSEGEASAWLLRERPLLRARGVEVACICRCKGRILLMLYRPTMLTSDFQDVRVRAFLCERGYAPGNLAQCLEHLEERFADEHFPHEVGLFLGYPFEDVSGFIEHGGRGYKYCGCWKVYSDEQRARRMFHRYATCTRSAMKSYQCGMGLERLIANG